MLHRESDTRISAGINFKKIGFVTVAVLHSHFIMVAVII